MASSSSDLGHARPEDDELASLDELYNINVVPSELFFKFRKQIEGFRVGANLEVLTCFSPRSFFCFLLIEFFIKFTSFLVLYVAFVYIELNLG